jgi:hypothetical protein
MGISLLREYEFHIVIKYINKNNTQVHNCSEVPPKSYEP